jgi:hypothetical protein
MHKQQRRQQTKQRQFKTIWVVEVYKINMLKPTGIITPVGLLYVLSTAGEFVWNEGGVVPGTCYLRLTSQSVIFLLVLK